LEATRKAGVRTELIESVPEIKGVNTGAIRFANQGQFHIMKYLQGLAKAITKKGGQIFTSTHAYDINEKGASANGYKIGASQIVVATNTPVNDLVTMHTKQFPYRTYVIAALISKDQITPALWWDTGDQESKWITHPYHYVRLQPFDEKNFLLIAGGEDHKTGQADAENIEERERYDALEKWVRKKFPSAGEVVYQWSGQVMEPLDSLAFIGKNPGDENVYIITGDSGNGMTHGTLAGIIISDLINSVENPWADLYNPKRIPLRVAGNYIKETMSMAAQYADWLTHSDIESAKDLKMNEGGIISSGLKKIAVYRDANNELHTFNAACPHLGCVVQWNGDEKTFDCPCHGSRFTNQGVVINGPSTEDLKRVTVKK
jgi:glycine/D-amino acid oxidase-like deaminating enzyme/nitrite reductase/ring-hydroxylating ferredoxin subunit